MLGEFFGGVGSAVAGSVGSSIGNKISNSLNPQPSSSELGKDQRAYLENAFPELNAWELAGAGQQGSSTTTATNASNRETANKQMALQAKLTDSQVKKNNAEVELTKQRAKNEANATSVIGRNVKDVKSIAGDAWDAGKGIIKSTIQKANDYYDKNPPSRTIGIKGATDGNVSDSKNKTNQNRYQIKMSTSPKARRLYQLQEDLQNAKTPQQRALIQKRINQLK